jgi:hypothetical protein
MPYSPMHKHCTPVKNLKGKTTGLMMEGSAMHMSMLHQESEEQEAKNDLNDTPVQDKASAMEMSPYKMGHEGSPTEMSPYKMSHQKEEPSKKTQRIREKREKLDDKFLDGKMSEEKYARKEARTRRKLEKSKQKDKESALEMSPYKMGHESPATFTGMSGGSALHQKLKMVKVNGKMVPEFAADGKGKNDLKKK